MYKNDLLRNSFFALIGALSLFAACASISAAEPKDRIAFNIRQQPLSDALAEWSRQSGLQVLHRDSNPSAAEPTTAEVSGTFSPAEALDKMLARTGLKYEFINERTVRIAPAAAAVTRAADLNGNLLRLARDETGKTSAGSQKNEEPAKAGAAQEAGTPELLVRGKRSINTDIVRTEDAPQPYVVFDREEIIRSQATNIEEFLSTRLPMNTSSVSGAQFPFGGTGDNRSSINLRGLGTNQTLILVDGRRVSGVAVDGLPQQSDINGIPPWAVERIEVLPATAGGIYGGSATGGVVNIIMRRDFRGVDTRITYNNTFDTDMGTMRYDLTGGFALEDGRTQIMAMASHMDGNDLTMGDRDFSRRGMALQIKNNRAAIGTGSTPPLGATINILSGEVIGPGVRRPLTLDPIYGGTALGSPMTHFPMGYLGPASDNGAALVANAGSYNLELPNDLNGLKRGLRNTPVTDSASLNIRREFGARVEAFLDLNRFDNKASTYTVGNSPTSVQSIPANSPFNPFQQRINVRIPIPNFAFRQRSWNTTDRATGGLIVRLPGQWTSELDYAWNRTHSKLIGTASVIDVVGINALRTGLTQADGRPGLNALQDGNINPIDFTPYLLPSPNDLQGPFDMFLKDTTLRASGPVLRLPGGPVMVSLMAARRQEKIDDAFHDEILSPTVTQISWYQERMQYADSYQTEARVPLVSPAMAQPLVNELELQASVRHDEYETRGVAQRSVFVTSHDGPFNPQPYSVNRLKSTDYTLALRYAPVQDLALRASLGTGFLPPALSLIGGVPQISTTNTFLFDPARGNEQVIGTPLQPVTQILGGNPNLRAEQSKSRSAGLILTPRFVPGLRLSVDYTRIRKRDEIQGAGAQFILNNYESYPDRIMRAAKLPGDPANYLGPVILIDGSVVNIARTDVEAYDINVDYRRQTAQWGEFRWYALATWQPHYRNQLLPTTPVVDFVGFNGAPLEWRGNLGVSWSRGLYEVQWNTQFFDSYWIYSAGADSATIASNVLSQGAARIPEQIYHDLIVSRRFDQGSGWARGLLANSQLDIGIQNVFDTLPPIIASVNTTAPGFSPFGDPRLRRYTVAFRKSFH